MKKQPQITEQTKNNLQNAFWQLYREKGIDKITIKNITDLSGYNRGTFYLYYTDIYDILRTIEDEILRDLKKIIDEFNCMSVKPDLHTIISAFVSLSDIYQDKTGVLLGPNGDPSFAERLKEIIWPLITSLFVSFEGYNSYETDLLAEFYLSGIIAMVNKWNRDSVLSLDELIKLVLPVVFPPDMTKTDSAN